MTSSVKPSDLHVQDLLEGLRIAISKEFDVVINKHHWWFMWGHHHLWKSKSLMLVSPLPRFLWTIIGRPVRPLNDPTWGSYGPNEGKGGEVGWTWQNQAVLAANKVETMVLYLGAHSSLFFSLLHTNYSMHEWARISFTGNYFWGIMSLGKNHH